MNRNRRRNVQQRQIPGCLGRMVNLFDFGTVGTGKKFLTDKPYFDDGSIKRNQLDLVEDKVDNIVVNGTPIKKLLEEEMSKEVGSTNLVAKLMGLDSFPHSQRSNSSKPRLKRSLSHGECKDVYEVLDKPGELSSKKKMDIVREKFLEAKRLVTDEKLRHSKEFQEAMEVLSSNKELFLEFLQESNNFFSHHHHHLQSTAPEMPKRITILKPSKTIDDDDKIEYPTKQSTRIVVLKPTGLVTKASSCPTSPRGLLEDGFEERKAKDVVRRAKREILKDETSHSSVFSNGYIIDDCYDADSEVMSPVSRHSWDYINKYDSPYSSSPFSRASGSPESSSVCREAKKRLSERWALMAASNESLQEAKVIEKKGGNISLGDMLALSDSMTDLRTEQEEVNDGNKEHDPRVSASCLPGNFSREEGNSKPFEGLMRSKSLPESSTSFGHKALDNNKGNKPKVPEELTRSKSLKWSLKSKVTNFLFSRNKKASTEENPESLDSRCNDECEASVSGEAGLSTCFPVSVLETSSDEDDEIFFNSSVLNRPSSSLEQEMMMSNLLGKSPSIGRNLSFNDSTVARCYSSKRSTITTSTRDEEEDLRLLINTLLSAAHLDEESKSLSPSSIIDHLLSKWHSVESPLDPSLRESYADADSTEQGSHVKKLVYDLVNTLLLELNPSYLGRSSSSHMLLSGKTLGSYVMKRMQECLKGNGRVEDRWWDEDGDLSSLAVNKVVRTEVAEIGSTESLRLEKECMGEEIELKLLEELVEEVFMDFSELFIPSIC